ncbi:hypothetical protein LTR53_009775 [Teratosphaeriaceae sp. CCFEE 6253]|nr:hypothetical protein LTR53_009775 [Teratosphaeriaceae sp. CCFEE 6253]
MVDSLGKRLAPQFCGHCSAGSKPDGGVLSTCAKCRIAYYCSKACQVAAWPTHKPACKMALAAYATAKPLPTLHSGLGIPGKLYPGVLLKAVYNPANNIGYTVESAGMGPAGAWDPALTFREAFTTTAIGFPLEIQLLGGSHIDPLARNDLVEVLALDPTPASPRFGRTALTNLSAVGSILAVHAEGRLLQTHHVSAVLQYLGGLMPTLRLAGSLTLNDEATVARQALVNEILTPKAFAGVWEGIKARAIADGEAGWEDLECPVEARPGLTAVLVKMMRGSEFRLTGTLPKPGTMTSPIRRSLPITKALGFPLSMIKCAEVGLQVVNEAVEMLCLVTDPASRKFGRSDKGLVPTGAVLLVRDDGRPLHVHHAMAVMDFVRRSVRPALRAVAESGQHRSPAFANRQELVEILLSPAAFVHEFEKIKQDAIDVGEVGWYGLECPILLDTEDK